MDVKVCRGLYLSPQNKDHHFVKQLGHHVISVARDQNRCWQRFIVIKEMMHMFADPITAADSGETFEQLLEDFSSQASEISPQMRSEFDCTWMALAAICREDKRIEYMEMRRRNEISDYQIALELKIPQLMLPNLFHAKYRSVIDQIIGA